MTSFLPVLLAKLTLILALGLIVAAILRSLSPSHRHLILVATFASGLALPVAMVLSPQWNVPVLPRSFSPVLSPTSGRAVSSANDPRSHSFTGSVAQKGATGSRLSNAALTAKVIDAAAEQPPAEARDFVAKVRNDELLAHPFFFLGVSDSAAEWRRSTRIFAAR